MFDEDVYENHCPIINDNCYDHSKCDDCEHQKELIKELEETKKK